MVKPAYIDPFTFYGPSVPKAPPIPVSPVEGPCFRWLTTGKHSNYHVWRLVRSARFRRVYFLGPDGFLAKGPAGAPADVEIETVVPVCIHCYTINWQELQYAESQAESPESFPTFLI